MPASKHSSRANASGNVNSFSHVLFDVGNVCSFAVVTDEVDVSSAFTLFLVRSEADDEESTDARDDIDFVSFDE